jgi:hypothetical protein
VFDVGAQAKVSHFRPEIAAAKTTSAPKPIDTLWPSRALVVCAAQA